MTECPFTIICVPFADVPKHGRYVYMVAADFISGAAAGAIAKTAIAPMDRAKINFQIKWALKILFKIRPRDTARRFYSADTPYSTRAAFQFLKNSFQNEGFMSLYRGNSATMMRIIPYSAIKFGSNEHYKKVLQVDKEGR